MKKFIILFSVLVTLSACTSGVNSFYVVDESKIQFDSFSFYEREKQSLNSKKVKLDSLIEELISKQLIIKGYNKSFPSDVYLSYKIISDKTYKTHTDYNYPGSSIYNNATPNYYNVTERKEGIFMIEVFDQDDKLLWQGSKEFKVNKSTNTIALLENYIEKIIASFKRVL